MLTHPTHDRLLAADQIGGLTGIAKALEEQRRSAAFDVLSFEDRLGLLVDRGEPEYKNDPEDRLPDERRTRRQEAGVPP